MSDSDLPVEEAESQLVKTGASGMSRRKFVTYTGATTATLALGSLAKGSAAGGEKAFGMPQELAAANETAKAPTDLPYHDRYRQKWSWDGLVKSTHTTNCGSSHSCAFNVYTKDGVVVREEQLSHYPQVKAGIPDSNPKGCQKGCGYSEFMYSKPRVTEPLKRVGERGDGNWEKISWDQALTEIAEKIVQVIKDNDPGSIVLDAGSDSFANSTGNAMLAFHDLFDAVTLDTGAEVGDEQQGVCLTYGDGAGGPSTDDVFYSDLLFIWGGNPVYTQITNMHFFNEARYNGTKVVCISPDFSPSALHADLWVPIKPGTDAALALSMCQVMIDEDIFDADLVREQTDLPCLIRMDTGRRLSEADLKKSGSVEQFYQYDTVRNKLFKLDANDLALNKRVPALEGEFEVETLTGVVKVCPTFAALKERLQNYTPEKASKICDIPARTIVTLGRMMANAKAATNEGNTGSGKLYHGDLIQRSQILAFVLGGHLGNKGAGFVTAPYYFPDGGYEFIKRSNTVKELRWELIKKHGFTVVKDRLTGKDRHRTAHRLFGDIFEVTRMASNSTLFWNVHGGLMDRTLANSDTELKRPLKDYLQEAEDNNWMELRDLKKQTPKVMFHWAGNSLRRVRRANTVREELWPKLELTVAVDLRLSSTAMYADYVLPVVSPYERSEVFGNFVPSANPYYHILEKAVDNIGQSQDDWYIMCELAKKVEQAARKMNCRTFTARNGRTRHLDNAYAHVTSGGKFKENDAEKMARHMVENSSNLGDISYEELKEKGFVRFSSLGKNPIAQAQAGDSPADDTFTPYTWHTRDKKPWFTITGRVQFLVEQDWYFEEDEHLPRHKTPPLAGGEHPVNLTGGHTRWSIHSMQRTDPLMLRLQRGQPCMWINADDAEDRNVADGELVRVWNDEGEFSIMAKVSPLLRPNQAVIYHAWENYQFEGGMGYRNVLASPLKPLELVGDQPFMERRVIVFQPGMSDRDTRINYAKHVS